MMANHLQVDNLFQLKSYINETLCQKGQLVPGVFAMKEQMLVRGKKPCGLFFCLHGPRSVKFTAIWETEQNTVFFYDSSGERFQKMRLTGRLLRLQNPLAKSSCRQAA